MRPRADSVIRPHRLPPIMGARKRTAGEDGRRASGGRRSAVVRTRPGTVAEFLERLDPDTRPVVEALRRIINDTVPDADVSIKWGQPTWKRRGLLCYIAPGKDHVTLGFHRGALLDDRHGLLEGAGKSMRHLKLRHLVEIDGPAIRDLVRQAVAIDCG